MTVRRCTTTSLVMAAVGLGLRAAAPDPGAVVAALGDPQRWVDTQGPDALVVLLAWALAVLCWTWGAVGLLLTAASAGPGLGGRIARALLTVVLPAGLRQAAALAVGLSLVAGPAVALGAPGPVGTGPAGTGVSAVLTTAGQAAPTDAPKRGVDATPFATATSPAVAVPPVPDWPAPAAAGEHVVLRGDCLWDIAAAWLAPRGPASDAQVAAAVQAWWQANTAVIGPDPDRLLPGQVLHAPSAP